MTTPDLAGQRRCTRCGETKPLTEFSFVKRRNTRLSQCKPCASAAVRQARARRIAQVGLDEVRRVERENTRKSRDNDHVRQRERAATRARNRAERRLARMYPKAFDALLREERSKLGLDPTPPKREVMS